MITIEQVKKCDPDEVFDKYEIQDNQVVLTKNIYQFTRSVLVYKNGPVWVSNNWITSPEFEVISRVRELIMKEG